MSTRNAQQFLGGAWIWLSLLMLSGVINLLALSGAFYMLQVYDRVLTSHSIETLVVLSALVAGLYLIFGLLDAIRAQILSRVGSRFDEELMPRAQESATWAVLANPPTADPVQPIRDVDLMRGFLTSAAPSALLDLPWIPLFLGFVWLLSPALGFLALGGLLALVTLAWLTDAATKGLEQTVSSRASLRSQELNSSLRNAETAAAMGFATDAAIRFLDANNRYCDAQGRSTDVIAWFAAASKVVRLLLQSAILGLGAYLAIHDQITTGGMIAASIAAARGLAPAELAIASWRTFSAARQSFGRLRPLAQSTATHTHPIALPAPRSTVSLERASVLNPITRRLCLSNVSLQLQAGSGLAIVGKSGSGKSTLARVLVGVCPLANGTLRFDGTPMDRWPVQDRGPLIGYLPQAVDLSDGTIADNIARLDPNPNSDLVVEAAKAAGIHEVIVHLPDGYETRVGTTGFALSAGQRQLVGLARALYGKPFLLVLDEPNTNLDSDGEAALIEALHGARRRGAIVVVIAHRRSMLGVCDLVAQLEGGQLRVFGPKSEVLENTVRAMPAANAPGRASRQSDTSKRMQAP